MEQKNLAMMQSELQTLAQLHKECAEHLIILAQQIDGVQASDLEDTSEAEWMFPENNYAKLVLWLTNDPWAKAHKTKWKNESWAAYAVRLSKYIGWNVDAYTLRRCFKRKNER